MTDLRAEADFFHEVVPKVRELVNSFGGEALVARHKKFVGDYATEIDIATEKLIVSEIKRLFPGDHILAEEEHADTVIDDARTWIIDPICGTTNLSRGLKNYCTNIALAENKKLVAACVIDHSQEDYFWSVGGNKLYVNDSLLEPQDVKTHTGVVIDVDLGALPNVSEQQKQKLHSASFKLSSGSGLTLVSLNTSLGFAYTAIGKIDGFITVFNHPWDICAAGFLIQQSGGVITDLEGNSWGISSGAVIAARDQSIHKKLLDAYSASR